MSGFKYKGRVGLGGIQLELGPFSI